VTALAILAVALAATAGDDPCAPVVPAGATDAAAAAEYRAVADAELSRGDRDTAAVAYRAAASLDPEDAASRGALARLCDEGPAFAKGVALLDAGDPRRALDAFRATHPAGAPTPAVALLEGICHYDLGEDALAEPLLRLAETSPAQRDAARLHLGLLRLRAGDASEAAAFLDASTYGPGLGGVARDLAKYARRDRNLVASFLVESGWDSNVTLGPSALAGAQSDGALALVGAVLWRPRGADGPYVRASGEVSEQLSLDVYDFSDLGGAAGWQHRTRWLTVAAEYGLSYQTLGGAPYLTGQRLVASAVASRGRTALGATYAARIDDYAQAYADYSGTTHLGELRLSVPLGRSRLALSYGAARDLARATALSFAEHGPRAELLVALGSRTRAGVEGGARFRAYDAAAAGATVARTDALLDASVFGEVDLSARLTARLTLQGRSVRSNVDALEYEKLVPFVGFLWAAGL
jgi:hypothetical protein